MTSCTGQLILACVYWVQCERNNYCMCRALTRPAALLCPSVCRFHKIQLLFLKQECCFVVVHKCKHPTDTLWKWCAEFTKRNPWVYVFWEGSQVQQLLPENIDRQVRCVRS